MSGAKAKRQPAGDSVKRQQMEVLQEAEDQACGLAIVSPVGIFRTDAAGHCLYVNERWCEISGLTPQEARGEGWARALHPEDRQRIFEEWYRAARDNVLFRSEHRFQRPDGRITWVFGQAAAQRGKAGEITGYVGTITDITERKRMEEELRARVRQQAVVAELGQRALGGADLSLLMDEAVARTAETLAVEYCKVLELLPGGEALLLRSGVGWQEGLVGQATVGSGSDSQAGYTLLSDEPVIVEDLRTETRFNGPPLLFAHGVVSGMSVIIQGEGRPWGVLGAHTRKRRIFTRDDVNFLRAVANVLAAAIERKQVEEALREAHDQLEVRVRERTGELERANAALQAEVADRKRAEEEIRKHQEVIRALSTPVLQVRERLLILPMIGEIDPARARQLTQQLLRAIRAHRAKVVVIDITGVPSMDATVANHLAQAIEAARLLGAKVIVTGLSREIAHTLVTIGVNLSKMRSMGDLQGGIEEAERLLANQSAVGSRQ